MVYRIDKASDAITILRAPGTPAGRLIVIPAAVIRRLAAPLFSSLSPQA